MEETGEGMLNKVDIQLKVEQLKQERKELIELYTNTIAEAILIVSTIDRQIVNFEGVLPIAAEGGEE